jgi:4-aminobutyrate aminotransferase-like enzyme
VLQLSSDFNTFGGNPVACAVGSAVLDTIKVDRLQQNALHVGQYLLDGFRKLQLKHQIIGDVRGLGLFVGMELVHDRKTLEPAAAAASYIANQMRDRNILISTDGPLHNVLKLKPPLCFSKQNARQVIQALDDIMSHQQLPGSDTVPQQLPIIPSKL